MIFCGTAVYIKPPPMVTVFGSAVLDLLHRRVKTVERRRAARRRNHRAKEHRVGTLPFHFVEHLLVVQAERPAIEHCDLGGFFLADERGDLGIQRIDREMAVAPWRPIAHGWRNK